MAGAGEQVALDPAGEEDGAAPSNLAVHCARLLASAARAVADTIVPPMCVACHVPLTAHDCLCAACWGEIAFIRAPICDRLGIPLTFDTGGQQVSAAALADPPAYDRARVVAIFSGPMQKLIHGFKYSDRHDGRRLFGRWLATAGADLLGDADVIVPVPLNRWRLLERRYNQAAILANQVARLTGKRSAPLTLARIRATPSQVGLTTAERQKNVAGAFKVPDARRNEVAGKRIVLVDDVITTGATLNAAARALKAAGAARVDVLALAIVTHTVL